MTAPESGLLGDVLDWLEGPREGETNVTFEASHHRPTELFTKKSPLRRLLRGRHRAR